MDQTQIAHETINTCVDIAGNAPYAGFSSCIAIPSTTRVALKNVRIWKEASGGTDWFIEPLPYDSVETAWTCHDFAGTEAQIVLYHRGPLNFYKDGNLEKIERRPTVAATSFGDLAERSIIDLGHYVGGTNADGVIIFQSGVVTE